MRQKDITCRLDARGLVLVKVNEQARGLKALRGYLEGRCKRTGT
jgi:hypothetical protein